MVREFTCWSKFNLHRMVKWMVARIFLIEHRLCFLGLVSPGSTQATFVSIWSPFSEWVKLSWNRFEVAGIRPGLMNTTQYNPLLYSNLLTVKPILIKSEPISYRSFSRESIFEVQPITTVKRYWSFITLRFKFRFWFCRSLARVLGVLWSRTKNDLNFLDWVLEAQQSRVNGQW